jgi:hypothetical protein
MRPFRVVIIAAVFLGLLASVSVAREVVLSWVGDPRAKAYQIEVLLDVCGTDPQWAVVEVVVQPDPYPETGVIVSIIDVPDGGLMLFRAVASDGSVNNTRTESGAWYNFQWTSMIPSGLGVR